MHGRERISGQRSGTGKARVRVLLIPAAGPRALMRRQRADLMRELVRPGYIMPARVTAPQTRRIVEVVVLEFDEGGLAALGDRRAGRRTVAAVAAGWTGRHRAETRVMKMLLHVGTGASGTGGTATAAAASTAAPGGSTAARHAVRGRGTRRTGVARPEWAPQIREIERRRAARTLHLRHNVDAAATAQDPCRRRTRRRRRRRRDRRVPSVRGPNFETSLRRGPRACTVRLCQPSVGISAGSRHRVARSDRRVFQFQLSSGVHIRGEEGRISLALGYLRRRYTITISRFFLFFPRDSLRYSLWATSKRSLLHVSGCRCSQDSRLDASVRQFGHH